MANDNSYEGSIFLIETDKIKPNPFQPRNEFNEDRLRDLADSIKQYGVLQPLVLTRKEVEREDGSFFSEYEIIAGERRWRASKMAGLPQVPAIIRSGEQTDKMKLELAIIENLQREDLNPVDRAQAFCRLVKEFNLTHTEVAKKIGRSREFVSNTIRIINLPQEILDALTSGQISEGHTRPLLMLSDRPEEQATIFKETLLKRLTVREVEAIARRIAYDKVRRKETMVEPDIIEMEEKLTEKYGNRVKVEKRENGGRVLIDYASVEDLRKILEMMYENKAGSIMELTGLVPEETRPPLPESFSEADRLGLNQPEKTDEDENLYFIKNFSL